MVKFDMSFMKDWKELTPVEVRAIEILKQGMEIIFKTIPNENIVCIYLKGSFPRREMKEDSDVDTSIIVNSDEALKLLNELQKTIGNSKELNFGFGAYSIEELKTGKLSKTGANNRPGPARFTRLIPSYKLIYGEGLNLKELSSKDDLIHLKNVIKVFYDIFFPSYENSKLSFEDMLKQALWLFELELAVKNQNFKFTSWNKMLDYFDENHFIYEVLSLRNAKKVDKKVEEDFILKLKLYVKKLSEEIN